MQGSQDPDLQHTSLDRRDTTSGRVAPGPPEPLEPVLLCAIRIRLVAFPPTATAATGIDRWKQSEVNVHRLERLGVGPASDVMDQRTDSRRRRNRGQRLPWISAAASRPARSPMAADFT